MNYYTLAISSSNHDSSICLLEDDKVLAMWPCERMSREKHTQKIIPRDLFLVKKYTNYIDHVILVNVYDENILPPELNTEPKFVELEDNGKLPPIWIHPKVSMSVSYFKQMAATIKLNYNKLTVDNSHHHTYHAAAGFYTSGFDDAVCVIMDGVGSCWAWKNASLAETTSFFYADQSYIRSTYKQLLYRPRNLMGWSAQYISKVKNLFKHPVDISPHLDVGKMYGTTTKFLGLGSSMDAGKTMGLSGYGKPNNLPSMLIDNTIISDLNLFRNDGRVNTFLYPHLINMSEQDKKDFAYNLQRATERIFVKRIEQALSIKPSSNLVIGGGCALNILGNTQIKKHFPHLNIYVDPIAADSSQSLGAALFHYKYNFPSTRYNQLKDLYLGPEYSIVDIKSRLRNLVRQYKDESSV